MTNRLLYLYDGIGLPKQLKIWLQSAETILSERTAIQTISTNFWERWRMDFSLRSEEEELRLAVQEFVRKELVPLEQMFERAPDIFVGSRWKTGARLSQDPEIQRWRGH